MLFLYKNMQGLIATHEFGPSFVGITNTEILSKDQVNSIYKEVS
jgi:hypothetical protein